MNEPEVGCESMLQRLEQLEERAAKLRWIVGGLLAATLILAGEALHLRGGRARKVEAEQFVVKDKAGKVRARLGADASGLPELVLLDSKGIVQAALHVYCDDAAALTLNEHGGTRVHLEATGDGNSAFRMFDRSGRSNSLLFMSPEGASGLLLNSEKSSALIGMKPGIDPAIVMSDAMGREQARLGSNEVNLVSLGLRKGPPVEIVPSGTAAGLPDPMATNDPHQKKITRIQTTEEFPGMTFPKFPSIDQNLEPVPGV